MLRKRPLFTGALFLAFLIWLLTGVFGLNPYPEKAARNRTGILTGEIAKIEEKTERVYLFLKDAAFVCGSEPPASSDAPSGFSDSARKDSKEELSKDEVTFGKVLLVVKRKDVQEAEELRIGNRISAVASCRGFSSARNPGNFDEALYYRSLGVWEKFEQKGALTVADERVRVLRDFLDRLRKRIVASIRDVADENTAGIFEAIVTGERSGLDQETKERFQKSGIAHILAISGLHISLLGMALLSLLRKRLPLLPAAVLSGLFMLCFCIMSGESASAVRATIMFLLRLLALLCGKRFDLLSALSLSGILLLLSNPLCLYNSGFQLSFGAILGIALLVPAFKRRFHEEDGHLEGARRNQGNTVLYSCLKKLQPAFFASLSVTLFTLPVVINSYYQIPLFSILLNLLVVPLMGFVLQGGMTGAFVGLISLFCGRMLIGLSVYLLDLIEFFCALLDQIPFSVVICGHLSPVRYVLYYAALLLFIRLAAAKKAKRIFAVLPGILLILLVFARPVRTELSITFFDVDQGDCILIESPSGLNYMIDGGSSSVTDVFRYRIQSALKYRGISCIDYILISHPDLDHISGILSLLEEEGAGSISAGEILIPYVENNENYDELMQKAEAAGVSVTSLHTGMRISDGEIAFQCLHPDSDYHPRDTNAYSAVMELTYGDFQALFTGDISEAEERILLEKDCLSSCSLLKVAHHGSRFSTTKEFLEAVNPEVAVVSAGVDNRYGHPHPDVLSRLQNAGAEIYTTPENGAVTVKASENGTCETECTLPNP